MITTCTCVGHFTREPSGHPGWSVDVADPDCPTVLHRSVA